MRLLVVVFTLAGSGLLFSADLRIESNSVVTTQINLLAGGRVGNWRQDNVVVLDGPPSVVQQSNYPNDIFTLHVPVGGPPYSANLVSLSVGFKGTLPPPGRFIGNAWFCPTSDKNNPQNEYMLFQAQSAKSRIGANANPGIGLDNQVWLYRGLDQKVWQLTTYGNLAVVNKDGSVVTGGGVLGPQCSEDSDSSTNTLHIVYAHIIRATPQELTCVNGPSTGTCGWFGDWELVYADIQFNALGDPDCSVQNTETPCFQPSTIVRVNPRDAVGVPFTPVAGTDGNIALSSSCGANAPYQLTSAADFSHIPAGAGVQVGTSYPWVYSIINSVSPNGNTLCLQQQVPTGQNSVFSVHNLNYIEPHRYVSNHGDLYYSTNSLFILHDSAGAIFNLANNRLRVLNNGYPPGTMQPGITNAGNTWFNEFLTPIPTNITTLTPMPPQRAIFMSDRAVPSKYSDVPEWSDHYMCGPPSCQLPVRMTEYNYNSGAAGGPDSPCSTCSPTVATRGAWSPDGSQYLTMNQYIVPNGTSTAELRLYIFQFPNAELGGPAQLSGPAMLQ